MQEFVYEDLFSRVFGYLRYSRIALTRDTALATLKVIEQMVVTDHRDGRDRGVVELSQRLEVADSPLPVPSPPINRGSIGYW